MYKLIAGNTAYQVEGPVPSVGDQVVITPGNPRTVTAVRHILTIAQGTNNLVDAVEVEA
jgi:hypothetical protein